MTQASEQQAGRKRFSFGPVWSKAVVAGTAKDKDKLVAHGVKLKVGSKSSLSTLKLETLITKVAAAIQAEDKTPATKKGKAEQAEEATA